MSYIPYSSVNYNKNLWILREKVSQDVYLRNSLFNISNRKSMYQFKQPIVQYISTAPRSKHSTGYSQMTTSFRASNKSISRGSTIKNNCSTISKARTVSLYDSILSSKEKVLKVKTLEIKKENDTFKKRLNRVSSPLSRKRFETMYTQNKKYSQNCKKVRTNSEMFDREMKILDRLPKLYLKKGKMVSY